MSSEKYIYVYNLESMDSVSFMVMDAKKEVKILLSKKAWTMKTLAQKMSEKSGKFYSQQNLNYRLRTNKLKLAEMDLICKLLGFKIIFAEIE